jgi:hypothetical protein
MKSSKPKTAEDNFREAFERLKAGTPRTLPLGTPVSQNNVAKEAGCDPSALRKARFPSLVAEIQNYLASHTIEHPPSERQKLLNQRKKSRKARDIINDLKVQRDAVASLLVEANAQIGILSRKVRDLEARLETLQSKASILQLPSGKPRATPRTTL